MFQMRTAGVAEQFRGERLLVLFLVLLFIAAAALAGLVTATGQPILIALVVGALLGVMLLNAVGVAVWLVLIGTLLVSGPLFMHVPQLTKAGWLFSLLGFFLLGVAALYPALGKVRQAGRVPGFIVLFAAFMVLGVISVVFSNGNLDEGVTGVKRYFQFYGLMFLLAVYPFKLSTVRHWVVFLGVVLLLHLPLALYQRLVIVPAWNYLNGFNGFVALDIVVGVFEGTFGGGGSSSVMAFSLLLGAAYIISAYRDNLLSTPKMLLMLLLVLAPLLLGETKVVVVWLPIVLLAISLDLVRKHPVGFLFGALISTFALAGFVWLYLTLQATDDRSLSLQQRLAESIAYNFGRAGYFGGRGLNRTTALVFWWDRHGLNNPIAFMFGHGLGSSYGAGERVPITGHMHDAYRGQGIGLTGVSAILWDLGLAGILLYYAAFVGATRSILRSTRAAAPGFDRAFCKTLLAGMALLWIVPFYTDQILQVPSMEVLSALIFGLIAWRSRTKAMPVSAPVRATEYRFHAAKPNAWDPMQPTFAPRRRRSTSTDVNTEPLVLAEATQRDEGRIEPTLSKF